MIETISFYSLFAFCMLGDVEAGTVHCPSCGASISSDSTQCQYCHTLLQTVACPSCFGLMFVGSKFCPHCGAAAKPVQQGPAVAHPCPRCPETNLQSAVVGGVALEDCPHCGGIWVACENFDKICADRQMQEAAVQLALPPPLPLEQALRYLKCPQCAQLMNRTNFAARSGVVIDRCMPHGIWLDRDEIRRIVEFIRAGGLAIARQREIEELKRQRSELESTRQVIQHDEYGAYSHLDEENAAGHILGGVASILFSLLK